MTPRLTEDMVRPTLKEVGDDPGVTKQRVQQIERTAPERRRIEAALPAVGAVAGAGLGYVTFDVSRLFLYYQ